MTNTILAIPLGKFNSVLCRFDADTREASFRTVQTTPGCCARSSSRRAGRGRTGRVGPSGWRRGA